MAKDPVKPEETKKKEDGKTKPEDELVNNIRLM